MSINRATANVLGVKSRMHLRDNYDAVIDDTFYTIKENIGIQFHCLSIAMLIIMLLD